MSFIDMTGWKMWEHGQLESRFIVLEKVGKQGKETTWLCECQCQNKTKKIVGGTHLRRKNGPTLSCGCLQKEKTSLINKSNIYIGQKFGHLTVLRETELREDGGSILYECQCDCEHKTILLIPSRHLNSGNTTSCGCRKISKGVEKITELLKNNNIDFLREWSNNKQFRYPDTHMPINFDFYLPKYNILIECDGIQHYNGWNNNLEQYNYIHSHDIYRNKISLENNFILIRIPYYAWDTLKIEDLLLTSKYIIKEFI